MLSAVEVSEGPFSAKISLSSDELYVQDKLILTLDLTFPKGFVVDPNQLRMSLLKNPTPHASPFGLDAEEADIKSDHMQIRYTLDPHTAGNQTLSFYDIDFKNNEGKVTKLVSPVFDVIVKEPVVDPNFLGRPSQLLNYSTVVPIEIDDANSESLFNPNENVNNQRILSEKTLPIFEVLVLAIFVLAIYIIRNYNKPSPEQELQKRILTAQQKALASLDDLKSDGKSPEEYFVTLTNTVRHYIEDKTQIRAPNYTTEEFLVKMQYHPLFSNSVRESLSHFLDSSDKVKFAKYSPSSKERDEAFQAAKNFILTN